MTTIQTREIIMVEVPGDAYGFTVSEPNTSFTVRYDLLFKRGIKWCAIKDIMPTNDGGNKAEKPIIIGTITNGTPDFEVEEFVESGGTSLVVGKGSIEHFKNYEHDDWRFPATSKIGSFISLLKSHKADLTKKWVCLRKNEK